MPDFGPRWPLVKKDRLGKGGQGHAYLVSDAQDPERREHVAKVLSGAHLTGQSPRWKRIEEEIEVCRSFNHPNVVRLIDSGHTRNSQYPYFRTYVSRVILTIELAQIIGQVTGFAGPDSLQNPIPVPGI